MSSRQEEKERRRQERLAQEQAEASSAARMRRVQIALGSLIAIAAVVGVVVAITSSGGGGGSSDAKKAGTDAKVAIPAPKETDLRAAAKAAGCTLLNPANEGRTHVEGNVVYKNSNPPASGPHAPVPAQDGIYTPGNEPNKENWVHSLEHGRILIQYKPGTPKHTRDQLETVGSEELRGTPGYHVLVFENNTKMPYAVAAVAWTHVLGCKAMNDRVFDAIRDFRKQYTDKAPELIP